MGVFERSLAEWWCAIAEVIHLDPYTLPYGQARAAVEYTKEHNRRAERQK